MADDKDKQKDEPRRASTSSGPSHVGAPSSGPSHGGDPSSSPTSSAPGRTPTAGDAKDIASRGPDNGGVTEAQHEEYTALGVNPRLDNRTGDQRPHGVEFAPKPQQFNGPEVGEFHAHAEEHGDEFREMFGVGEGSRGEPIGSKAEGPHGRGAEEV